MITLVIVYCLTAAPAVCQESRPAFERPLTGMACMMAAQPTAAAWIAANPDWTLSTWRCEKDAKREIPA